MKKQICILLLAFSFFLNNCNKTKYVHLENDSLVKKHFNKNEIKDLRNILFFFENEINKNCDKTNKECFRQYLKNGGENYKNKKLGINKEKQANILKNISNSTFNKIWRYGYRTKDSIDIIMINPGSKYMDFLEDLGSVKPNIKKYYNAATSIPVVLNAGSINYVFFHYNDFDLKDEKERLVLAIHFLTLNSIYF